MKSRETRIIGNALRTLDFLTDLKIHKDMDRNLKKKIATFNSNTQRLRLKIPEGNVSTLQPDLIITVHTFIAENESLLNDIQKSLQLEDSKLDHWNETIAQVSLLLHEATHFQQWAKEVIPDWFEKRKRLIPLPTELFLSKKPKHFSSYYYAYIEHFIRHEALPIQPDCELNMLLMNISQLIALDTAAAYISPYIRTAKGIVLATQLHSEDDLIMHEKFMASLACDYNKDAYRDIAKEKLKYLIELIKVLNTLPNWQKKTNRIQTVSTSLLSIIEGGSREYKKLSSKTINSVLREYLTLVTYEEYAPISLTIIEKCITLYNKSYKYEIDTSLFTQSLLLTKNYQLLLTFYSTCLEHDKFIVKYKISLMDDIPKELTHLSSFIPKEAPYLSCATLAKSSFNANMEAILASLKGAEQVDVFCAELFAQSVIKTYPHDDVIRYVSDYFSQLNRRSSESEYAFIHYLLNNTHTNIIEALDFKSKKELTQLMTNALINDLKLYTPLLSHVNESEHKTLFKLISHSGIYFNPYALTILKLYPLKKGETPISYCEKKIRMPLGLYMALLQANKDIPVSFDKFHERFKKADNFNRQQRNQEEMNAIDYDEFMVIHLVKLMNLYEVMGNDVFYFLKKKIATSTNDIHRYFTTYSPIPETYFQPLRVLNDRFKSEACEKVSRYDDILIQIGQIEEIFYELEVTLMIDVETLRHQFITAFEESCNVDSLQMVDTFLSEETIALYKVLLKLPADGNYDFSKLTQDKGLLSRLLIGRKAMKNEKLSGLFDKFIEYDLKKDEGFSHFSTNTHQTDSLGCKLAWFNKDIETSLVQLGVNTQTAFHYDKTVEFTLGATHQWDVDALTKAIYADLKNVQAILPKTPQTNLIGFFTSHNAHQITLIVNNMGKILEQVEKSKKGLQYAFIKNKLSATFRTKIVLALHALFTTEHVPDALKEHGKHFIDHNKLLVDITQEESNASKKAMPEKHFVIKQWDKSQIQTFLLGDYLGCCLAPDGGRFPAIVQRRLDAAMMMHVIYDKEKNEPVCGNWLFFGYDTDNPKDVYVVANFFEIRAGYGLNPELRDNLVNQLSAFTAQYAQDVGSKGFIIRPLTYGLIPDFKAYPTKEMTLAKVGGFFSLHNQWDQSLIEECYYLDALKDNSFYAYPSKSSQEQTRMAFI